jgi:hypothetical protein
MSPPGTESAAFENSTASCDVAPTAVETRSQFRYKIEGGHGALVPQSSKREERPLLSYDNSREKF